MDWPARSLDKNPIENVWGEHSRKIYEGGQQYGSVVQMKQEIIDRWYNFDPVFLQNLVLSMSTHIFKLIKVNGK